MAPLANHQISKIQLFNSKFENKHITAESPELKEERVYSSKVNIVIASPQWLIAFCDYKVYTTIGDKENKSIEATYTISMSYGDKFSIEERKSALVDAAGKQAWMLFREFFNLVNNHASFNFPPLPFEPDITIGDACSFDDFKENLGDEKQAE